MVRKTSLKNIKRIIELNNAGLSSSKISSMTGVPYTTVRVYSREKIKPEDSSYNYFKKLVKNKGFDSVSSYLEDWAKKRGYESYAKYQAELREKKKQETEQETDTNKYRIISAFFKKELKTRKISRKQFSYLANIPFRTITGYLGSCRRPSEKNLNKMLVSLGMEQTSLDNLIESLTKHQ